MKAVILCGGKGTRIRDVADDIPKPMIRIGQFPIVEHVMNTYSQHGVDEFVLCLGYRGWHLKEYFLNYRQATHDVVLDLRSGSVDLKTAGDEIPDWRVILAETGLETQTGARLSRVRHHLGDETFMLTYGDGVGNVDLTELLAFHRSHGRLATITSVRPPSRFGELVTDGDEVVLFEEKPQVHGGRINGGFFVCEPGVLDYVNDDVDCSFELGPLANLAKDGELMMYRHDGFWMPMDTLREHLLLNDLWKSGQAPWASTDR